MILQLLNDFEYKYRSFLLSNPCLWLGLTCAFIVLTAPPQDPPDFVVLIGP
jgi:hypothetical protein